MIEILFILSQLGQVVELPAPYGAEELRELIQTTRQVAPEPETESVEHLEVAAEPRGPPHGVLLLSKPIAAEPWILSGGVLPLYKPKSLAAQLL